MKLRGISNRVVTKESLSTACVADEKGGKKKKDERQGFFLSPTHRSFHSRSPLSYSKLSTRVAKTENLTVGTRQKVI